MKVLVVVQLLAVLASTVLVITWWLVLGLVLEGLYPYLQCGVVIFPPSDFGLQITALLVTHNFIFYPHHELLAALSTVGTTISLILIHPPIGYELLANRP